MQVCISLDDFFALVKMLQSLSGLELLDPASYMVTWEKRPRLTINRLGNFEFANPQGIYGAGLTFWDEWNNVVYYKRFTLIDAGGDDNE